MIIDNPSTIGPIATRRVVYATPGLTYGRTKYLQSYFAFDSPVPGFETRTIDLSDIADFDARYDWPFDNAHAPINGIVVIPDGDGPFPLAVFAHGNHNAAENSTPGYLYLCDLLASQGILAATVDVNFLNGSNRGENDGRAIVHLEHLNQFRLWNSQNGHMLFNRIDLSRILIAGHSRGGEAVGHASIFNRLQEVKFDPQGPPISLTGAGGLGPYDFSLKAVVAIAPTEQQYVPTSGLARIEDNYFLIHGSRDGDVWNFGGHLCHDRSQRLDIENPVQVAKGEKGLLWVHGANHNYFNSEWGQDSASTITRNEQEQIAKVYIGAIARTYLLGQSAYQEIVVYPQHAFDQGWLPRRYEFVSQYQPSNRVFIQHCEEPSASVQVSAPIQGQITHSDITLSKTRLAKPAGAGPRSIDGTPLDYSNHLYQDSFGARIEWTLAGGSYTVEINPETIPSPEFTHIGFRVGQSSEHQNTVGAVQDFTLAFHDLVGGTAQFSVSQAGSPLFYPDKFPTFRPQFPYQDTLYPPRTDPVTVLQTVFVSRTQLEEMGVDPVQLTKIEFLFDRTDQGVIYLDNMQLTTL